MYVRVVPLVAATTDIFFLRPGTLPIGQNSPQKCKYDLYAEGVRLYPFIYPSSSISRGDFRSMALLSPHRGRRTSARTYPHVMAAHDHRFDMDPFHSWFYRIRPSVAHDGFIKAPKQNEFVSYAAQYRTLGASD